VRFPEHDGKVFENRPGIGGERLLPDKPTGYYHEWTAAPSGVGRGTHRVIVGGDPKNPDVIYYWDHDKTIIRVGP